MGLTLHIPDGQWRPIAWRARTAKDPTWIELAGAPPLEQVQLRRNRGELITCLRYDPQFVTVVVRPAPGAEA